MNEAGPRAATERPGEPHTSACGSVLRDEAAGRGCSGGGGHEPLPTRCHLAWRRPRAPGVATALSTSPRALGVPRAESRVLPAARPAAHRSREPSPWCRLAAPARLGTVHLSPPGSPGPACASSQVRPREPDAQHSGCHRALGPLGATWWPARHTVTVSLQRRFCAACGTWEAFASFSSASEPRRRAGHAFPAWQAAQLLSSPTLVLGSFLPGTEKRLGFPPQGARAGWFRKGSPAQGDAHQKPPHPPRPGGVQGCKDGGAGKAEQSSSPQGASPTWGVVAGQSSSG